MDFSYKGKILISTPDISGDIFSRSVVLVIEDNELGSFGLILNRKSKVLSQKVRSDFHFDIDVYEGGPVQAERISVILKGRKITELYNEIDENFYATEDLSAVMQAILEGDLSTQDIKVFSGYSGWGAGQLADEVRRKMWTVADVYNMDFTMPNDHSLWKKIMENLGGEYLLFANAPKDISLN